MVKGKVFDHLALFLLVLLALILPLGLLIVPIVAQKLGFASKISSLTTICSNFSSIFSKKRSNIAHLSDNVDVLDSVKSTKKEPFA